jgi:predicted aspartyl protease
LLSALRTERQEDRYDLMHVNAVVNGIEVAALVDTGATSVFVSEQIVAKLGLQVQRCPNRVKAVNSRSQQMRGMARDVPVRIGEWEGKLDVMVVELDDYDVILSNSFFVEASITIMPCLGGCLIGDPK